MMFHGLVGFSIEIVVQDIGGECDDGCAKTREEIPEHGTVREDRVLAPGLTFGPRVAA